MRPSATTCLSCHSPRLHDDRVEILNLVRFCFSRRRNASVDRLQARQWSERVIRTVHRPQWKVRGGAVPRDVLMMVTPRVVEEARNHFGCPDLEGAELEDQGDEGTSLTHWEKRVFEVSDIPTASAAVNLLLSLDISFIYLLYVCLSERSHDGDAHPESCVLQTHPGFDGRHRVVPCKLQHGPAPPMGTPTWVRLCHEELQGLDGHKALSVRLKIVLSEFSAFFKSCY